MRELLARKAITLFNQWHYWICWKLLISHHSMQDEAHYSKIGQIIKPTILEGRSQRNAQKGVKYKLQNLSNLVWYNIVLRPVAYQQHKQGQHFIQILFKEIKHICEPIYQNEHPGHHKKFAVQTSFEEACPNLLQNC